MSYIEYTEEMLKQDTLLESNSENVEVMERLHRSILQQAEKMGLIESGITMSYNFPHRVETKVFKKDSISESDESNVFFSCNQLIKEVEIDREESDLRFAIKKTIEEFEPNIILEIMNSEDEEERYGWSNNAELLNVKKAQEVEVVLSKMKLLN